MIRRLPPREALTGIDDEDLLLADARYPCPCGRSARLPLAPLAALGARWTPDEDSHLEPRHAKRFAPAKAALLNDHEGAFLLEIVCGCGAPAVIGLRLEERRGVERVRALGVLVHALDR